MRKRGGRALLSEYLWGFRSVFFHNGNFLPSHIVLENNSNYKITSETGIQIFCLEIYIAS